MFSKKFESEEIERKNHKSALKWSLVCVPNPGLFNRNLRKTHSMNPFRSNFIQFMKSYPSL